MLKERTDISRIEKELKFIQWCKKEGVKIFLIDLDDTCCPTVPVFRKVMDEAYDYLSQNEPMYSTETWKSAIREINNRYFETKGVNPIRWNLVVDELAEKFSIQKNVADETKSILSTIYNTPIGLLEGAEEGLSFLKKLDVPVGIVTHANKEWTWKKFNWMNLERFVSWDDVYIVDENGHKTSESWLSAMNYFKVKPGECAVVGDSPRSDINPAWELGARHCFLVDDTNRWSIHEQPIDKEVKIIADLSKIPEVVLGL